MMINGHKISSSAAFCRCGLTVSFKHVNAADNSSSEHRRNLQDIKLCPHLCYTFNFNFLLLHVNLENSIHFGTEHFEAFKT